MQKNKRIALIGLLLLLTGLLTFACAEGTREIIPEKAEHTTEVQKTEKRTPRLALWLAKKDELLASEDAVYDLVMTGWVEPQEAQTINERHPQTMLLGGLSHTWVLMDDAWLRFFLTVANGGDADGALQITEDMYLMKDADGDGVLDKHCEMVGWEGLYAMDPRHEEWQTLVLSFYEVMGQQEQHDGVIVDMVDAYPFCEGYQSAGVPQPLDAQIWIDGQAQLLDRIREKVPEKKWLIANAGHDFEAGSPFTQYLNGYLLENFLGEWGAGLEDGLASAERALETTRAPHIVVFAVDTDDSGEIDWQRFRTGLAASMLLDNTYFAFDYGARDHGGVRDYWFVEYYNMDLGEPLGAYRYEEGGYRRDFENGVVLIAHEGDVMQTFEEAYKDLIMDESGKQFTVQQGDAGFFVVGE